MSKTSFEELCYRLSSGSSTDLSALLPEGILQEVGHFNVFNLTEITQTTREKPPIPYDCRAFYKISLLTGHSKVEYNDQTIEILKPSLIFSTPKNPFTWSPIGIQTGLFCVFSAEFLHPSRSGVILDELPIFKSTENFIYTLSNTDLPHVERIFENMQNEISSNYVYKYDFLRAYTLELIHVGQKLQSKTVLHSGHTASERLTSLFLELLEKQYPIENPQQKIALRTAKQFADHLAVHVNHLNKILKDTTSLTTTELIAGRITQEAKALLRHTEWTIAEIAESLGFSDFSHFAHFFKSQASLSPGAFRSQLKSLNYT